MSIRKPDVQPGESLTFEQAIASIETITEEIDQGKLPLDKLVTKFQEAAELVKSSSKMLAKVEQQIKVLDRDLRDQSDK